MHRPSCSSPGAQSPTMCRVIAFRKWFNTPESWGRRAACVMILVGALVWAHGGGETQVTTEEHGLEHDLIGVCLAVLTGIAAVGLATQESPPLTGMTLYAPLPPTLSRLSGLGPRGASRPPPPRREPAALQVFLR